MVNHPPPLPHPSASTEDTKTLIYQAFLCLMLLYYSANNRHNLAAFVSNMLSNTVTHNQVTHMALSDAAIRLTKPSDKTIRKSDGNGLVLLINPNGSRWWKFRYRIGGKAKMISLGTYPETSLADARQKRDELRKLLAAG